MFSIAKNLFAAAHLFLLAHRRKADEIGLERSSTLVRTWSSMPGAVPGKSGLSLGLTNVLFFFFPACHATASMS